MRQNRSIPDVQEKRKNWRAHIPENGAKHLVFFDESGVNTDMTRHYARSKKNEQAVDSAPVNAPCNTTILFFVRLNGKTYHTIYCGGTTSERFAEYLKTDIIVMDNMRSHHAKVVRQVLDESGINYLYLPPYSPYLNPIEKIWSKLKAYLRKKKGRIASELPPAIERAFSTVWDSDGLGWFR